jgi:hypothetical protein
MFIERVANVFRFFDRPKMVKCQRAGCTKQFVPYVDSPSDRYCSTCNFELAHIANRTRISAVNSAHGKTIVSWGFHPETKKKLEQEITSYLRTITPTILLLPPAFDIALDFLKNSNKRHANELLQQIDSKYVNTLNQFLNELFVFVELLQTKGIRVNGHEFEFLDLLVQKTREKNAKIYKKRCRNFLKGVQDLESALFRLFDVLGEDTSYDVGLLDYVAICLYERGIADFRKNIDGLQNKIAEVYDKYLLRRKVANLQRRMDSTGHTARVSIDLIDELSGVDFENFLAVLFRRLGYRVETTKTTGDQGVDLLLYKNNECVAVQAKCYQSSVGNDAVQQVVAGMKYYKADKSMVVTNSYYTEGARQLAERTNTILWDREKLKDMINLLF